MKTVKEVVDEYLKSQNRPVTYSKVTVRSDGVDYIFEHVTNIQQTTNYQFVSEQDYIISHSTMMFGHITYLETEITGKIVLKTKKVGKGEYSGDQS